MIALNSIGEREACKPRFSTINTPPDVLQDPSENVTQQDRPRRTSDEVLGFGVVHVAQYRHGETACPHNRPGQKLAHLLGPKP